MSRYTCKIHRRHRNCAGLTLVELMIALVLSMLLMTGVLTIFASTKTTSKLQSGLATVQENGRHALHLLVRDIRSAGFGGCAGMDLTITNVIAKNPPKEGFDDDQVVFGINDINIDDADDPDDPYDAVDGTDVIRVRGAGDGVAGLVGNTVPVNANIQTTKINHLFKDGDILMLTDCEGTDVFRATNVSQSTANNKTTVGHAADSNTDVNLSKPYDKDAFLMRFRSNAYFIKDTTRTNRVGHAIRALYWRDETKRDPSTGEYIEVELVDGIEDMQITYGVDGDGNGMVDKFVVASNVDSWSDVLAVKISLLVSSVENAAEAPTSYRYVGLTTVPVDSNDMQLRQEMTSTVALRNRVD